MGCVTRVPSMNQRLGYGALLIIALVALIYFDAALGNSDFYRSVAQPLHRIGVYSCHGLLVVGVVLALVLFATREMANLARAAGHAPLAAWATLANLTLVAIPFLAANGPTDAVDSAQAVDWRFTVGALVVAFAGAALGAAARKKSDGAIGAIGSTLLMIFYIGLLASFLVRLRVFGPAGASWLLLYYVGVVKACDIGAYFTGRAIGRTKLIEWLSPKKTIEGLAGGIAASIGVAVAVPLIVRAGEGAAQNDPFPTLINAAIFGAAMALVGHAGDLLESLFKRDANAKDSAAAVPAFGGVLDIIDSPLLTAPLAYVLLLK